MLHASASAEVTNPDASTAQWLTPGRRGPHPDEPSGDKPIRRYWAAETTMPVENPLGLVDDDETIASAILESACRSALGRQAPAWPRTSGQPR